MVTNKSIHQGQPILTAGEAPADTKLNVIMLHGRGASAEGLKPLVDALMLPGLRFHLPQAARDYWYPQSAFSPIESNQPDLDSALSLLDDLVAALNSTGFDDQQLCFGGFSQGACLAAEYTARNARPYAGLFIFSGALIGPEGTPRDYPGDFAGMPAFIGGSDVDPWVSHDLLKQTARIFQRMGAEVDFQTYPGMGHTVNQDEMDRTRAMLSQGLAAASKKPKQL